MLSKLHRLQLIKQKVELFWRHSRGHENQGTHDAHFERLMLFRGNVPHFLELPLGQLSLLVQKIEQDGGLLDDFRMERCSKEHAKDLLFAKPLN